MDDDKSMVASQEGYMLFFYKHIKIRKQAQRCLGRELDKAEKMLEARLEGCLYPKIIFLEDAYEDKRIRLKICLNFHKHSNSYETFEFF